MKKMEEEASEPSSGKLAMKATMEAMILARTSTANSPSPWLAWPSYYVEEVERKTVQLTAS